MDGEFLVMVGVLFDDVCWWWGCEMNDWVVLICFDELCCWCFLIELMECWNGKVWFSVCVYMYMFFLFFCGVFFGVDDNEVYNFFGWYVSE